jgi:hypothetical protein
MNWKIIVQEYEFLHKLIKKIKREKKIDEYFIDRLKEIFFLLRICGILLKGSIPK